MAVVVLVLLLILLIIPDSISKKDVTEMSAVLRSTKQYQTTMKKAMPTEINESQVLDI